MTVERWQKLMYWPLNVASIVFLIVYSWRVIADLTGPAALGLNLVLVLVWAMFAVFFFIALAVAHPRGAWFKKNWWQLFFVLVPALQPVRLLRLVPLITRSHSSKSSTLRTQISFYVGSTLVLVVYVGSIMVLDFEHNAPGATIRSFGDAIWWACVTVTTVGYGDYVPVTVAGRLVAVALMISGVALIGTVTGTLASYLGERARGDDPHRQAATRADYADLAKQIEQLSALVKSPPSAGPDSADRADPPPSAG